MTVQTSVCSDTPLHFFFTPCYASPMSDDKRDSKNLQDTAIAWARYSEIAFIIPAAVVVGLLLGKLGDYFFHTHWLTITGIIFGAIVGFVQLIRTVLRDKS